MPYFSIIIVNFNGRKCLEVCLPSIMKQTFLDFEVIIVDNGSKDDSVSYIRSHYKNIKVLPNAHNSFSSGNNLGIKHSQGKFIFVLNNDVELDSRCLEILAKKTQSSAPEIGMWAAKILNFYSRDIIDGTGLVIYRDGLCRGRGRMENDHGQFDGSEDVFFPSGCAAIYRKTMLDEIGLFDEDFQFYLEDADLGFRARLMKWQCLYVPGAVVYHMYSASSGQYSPFKAGLIERNRVWLTLKNYPILWLSLSPWYIIKRYIFQAISAITRRGSAGKFVENVSVITLFKVLFNAWIQAIRGAPKMLKKRRIIQRDKRVDAGEIGMWFNKYKLKVSELTFKN